jgi:hypothetical protein
MPCRKQSRNRRICYIIVGLRANSARRVEFREVREGDGAPITVTLIPPAAGGISVRNPARNGMEGARNYRSILWEGLLLQLIRMTEMVMYGIAQ